MEFAVELTHATKAGDCDTDGDNANDAFCASESYTFHVGPMADLAVRAGDADFYGGADRHGLALVAVNYGPDTSLGTRVTGLPRGAEVISISAGSYDAGAGEWNIGDLWVPDYYRSRGEPEPTLVLRAQAGDAAYVSIASQAQYEVCVGPKDHPGDLGYDTRSDCETVPNASWNSTPVYDYNADNNTATIAAAQGTGGGAPGAPESLSLQRYGYATLLTWQPVERVYGVPVAHYEVQRSASPWETLPDIPKEPKYLDTTVESANALYRVRAVNEAGVPGPWSAARSTTTVATAVADVAITSTPLQGDTYQLGEDIIVAVSFTEPVRVTGIPRLSLDIGGVVKRVAMTGHAGDTLTFRYTVVQGDQDADDGISVPRNGLTLSAGESITDAGGNAAVLFFAGLGNQAGHKVRTVADPSAPPTEPPPFHAEPPPAPEALTATPGDGQVTLEWGPYCCDVKDIFYQIWRGDSPTWRDIPNSDRNTVSHTVTGLENGAEYSFRVRAVYRHRADDGSVTEHAGPASRTVMATPSAPDPNRGPNNPPVFQRPANESFSVVERAPLGTRVATVRATDPDGDRLTYTLSGEHHARFSIANVNGAGVITVAEAELSIPWSENNTAFSLGVEVADNRGGRDRRAVVVALEPSPLRDNPPVAEEPENVSIACGAGVGAELVTLRADDPEGDALRFMLVDGDLDGKGGYFKFRGGTTGDHGDFWGDTHGLLVEDGSDAEAMLQVAQAFPEDLCGRSYGIIVEVEEAENPGNNHTLQFGFLIEPKSE